MDLEVENLPLSMAVLQKKTKQKTKTKQNKRIKNLLNSMVANFSYKHCRICQG